MRLGDLFSFLHFKRAMRPVERNWNQRETEIPSYTLSEDLRSDLSVIPENIVICMFSLGKEAKYFERIPFIIFSNQVDNVYF